MSGSQGAVLEPPEMADLFLQLHAPPVAIPAVTQAPAPVVDPPTATVEPSARAVSAAPIGCPAPIVDTFGERAPEACAVSFCESRWNPAAVGDAGASLGYFQIQPQWWQHLVPGEDLGDPAVNVRAAYIISKGGTYWWPWTCKP